ncbi:hypothetical protein [Chryseobacterium sp.]|uniref:ATP-binding protein n=1 Tax=Elizabethkingia anophelis TaxID=1117645 RepID=A0AAE4T5C2_9FLAO|nr:hypothetical protein [Chryseobacterium sp.]MBS1740470.1 hypothetical protein [Bacteroidota bacterium]MDV3664404.1 hypothetical protein [Elizabethkingia anophelis]MPS63257.1 hypothetical protein [Chryseobacterium sp.]
MEVPVKNLVETVDLTAEDVLLPMLECVVNSVISLQKSSLPANEKKIQIQITRGDLPTNLHFDNLKTILGYKVIDNGIGFNTNNYKSFQTPFSQVNKDFGCKGIGRFTVLAAYKDFLVESNYEENATWHNRKFKFSTEKELEIIEFGNSDVQQWKTIVNIENCTNHILIEKSALSLLQISESIMQHCFIYYLNNSLPRIEVIDLENNEVEVINELFEKVSKEKERDFPLKGEDFKFYITKTIKEGNRKNNYLYYCANNRTVGNPKNIKNINSIFSYPIQIDNEYYFFDIYVVSDFLNKKVFKTRNGFNIPKERENLLFSDDNTITFQDIEEQISSILENEYDSFVKTAKQKNIDTVKSYISHKAPRFNSFLKNPEILNSIPPNLSEDKLEEHLYRISFNARRSVENNIEKFIKTKEVNEDAISQIINDIKAKTAYDVDSLADYMMRRKAIINLFDKFLDADENGDYKLEEDVHNLIFPLGLTNNDLDYENHNLWILDERFISYKFIASDKAITSFSQMKSRKETDLILIDNPQMFNNPISFGDKASGEVNSMVIFEFKRPGDVAHQKNKTDYRWEFSELVEPYFEEFIYQPIKKNYKGNQIVLKETTPKFGYIILDIIPEPLARYNKNKGWKATPFGTYFKIEAELNLHLEVMTFRQLLEASKQRHNPFFDKLFT